MFKKKVWTQNTCLCGSVSLLNQVQIENRLRYCVAYISAPALWITRGFPRRIGIIQTQNLWINSWDLSANINRITNHGNPRGIKLFKEQEAQNIHLWEWKSNYCKSRTEKKLSSFHFKMSDDVASQILPLAVYVWQFLVSPNIHIKIITFEITISRTICDASFIRSYLIRNSID